ncbi:MAG: rRNA adenine dimethyltransferase family protein [Patescibacteria group bacterium]
MFRAKKSLGQNFLKSEKILDKIIETADLKTGDIVLEVGPGQGILTKKLLEKAGKVIAVEKDNRLIGSLQNKFADEIKKGKLEIISADILDLKINSEGIYYFLDRFVPREDDNKASRDEKLCFSSLDDYKASVGVKQSFSSLREVKRSPKQILKQFEWASEMTKPHLQVVKQSRNLKENIILNTKYKIVANIPYYITGQFLRKFLSADFQPSKIVVMLQKEVAQRICSGNSLGNAIPKYLGIAFPSEFPSKESILSLSVKTYGKPQYIATVKAENFSPQPKVDSAILLIDDISKDFFKNIDENVFFQLVRAGFSSKRKMLINNLFTSFSTQIKKTKSAEVEPPQISKENLTHIFEKLGISLKTRAEDLNLKDWRALCMAGLFDHP